VNRIDRVSAILIQLQSKKFVCAGEIADRFCISKRTVYRDIRALEEAGVPLSTEPGKGYFLVDGYHLPPVMFTPEEASSLLTAEKIMEKMSDKSIDSQYKSALYKIKAVLPEKDKQYLETLNNNIEIFHSAPVVASEAPNNYMLTVQKALVNKKTLCIGYRPGYNHQKIENRMVEPVGLCFYSMAWHLIGFCKLRMDYRDFRLDRITNLTTTDVSFEPRKFKTVREFFQSNLADYQLEEVTIRLPQSETQIIQTSRYYFGYMGEEVKGDFVEMNFVTNDLTYFCRWMLSFADVVEVVSNDALKKAFAALVGRIVSKWGSRR
jgi:predicted DNA-binding transcriptional regulator YafY